MIFIGNFQVLTHQENVEEKERRHGEFNMIVYTDTKEAAVTQFRRRIMALRKASEFFSGDCTVFLIQLMAFDKLPENLPVMLTYKSTAGDPMMPFIGCLAPTDVNDACRVFNWKNNRPEIDGIGEQHFISFTRDEVDIPRIDGTGLLEELS